MIKMLRIYLNGFLENVTIEELTPGLSHIRNAFDFWNNLVLNYLWEPVPIGQRFLDSLRLWKVIHNEKCQFSPTLLLLQDLLGHGQITTTQRYCRVANLKVQRNYYKAMQVVLQMTQGQQGDDDEGQKMDLPELS